MTCNTVVYKLKFHDSNGNIKSCRKKCKVTLISALMFMSFAANLNITCLCEGPPAFDHAFSPMMASPVPVAVILLSSPAPLMAKTVAFAASFATCVIVFLIAS